MQNDDFEESRGSEGVVSIEAFPLQWPVGYPRTKYPRRAIYKAQMAKARDGLTHELCLMHASRVVVSTNIPLRRDGLPYAGMAQPQDVGAAVYFLYKGKQLVLACDKWDRVDDNIRAIAMTVEAMRGMERWGVSEMLDRAFTGFAALPAPEQSKSWHHVLGVDPNWSIEEIETVYRNSVKRAHPDVGGSHEQMTELNGAIAEARRTKVSP